MKSIEELILGSVKNYFESNKAEQLIRVSIDKAISDAIQDSFNWGETSKALNKKINDLLVPAIERFDLSAYNAKLDAVLTEIIENTNLVENRRLLKNFKGLMIEPEYKEISIDKLFEAYKSYVAADLDCCGREVMTDDSEPYYASINVYGNFTLEERPSWLHSDHGRIVFQIDSADEAAEDQSEDFNRSIRVYRYEGQYDEGYYLGPEYRDIPILQDLADMCSFDVLLLRLKRANARILIPDGEVTTLEDEVFPNAEPEATYE